MTDQTVLMTQFLNALATRAEPTKSAFVAIRPANGRQAVSRQYKALIMPRAVGAKRPLVGPTWPSTTGKFCAPKTSTL
jgi:hypothetical protein